jgi:two-component sensor histidine kinase
MLNFSIGDKETVEGLAMPSEAGEYNQYSQVDQSGTTEGLKPEGDRSDRNGRVATVMPFLRTVEEDAVAEADHRIANNLAIIAGMVRDASAKLKTDPHRDHDIAISVLADLSTRIEAIAQLHRILTEQRGRAQIDLPKYLREIIKAAKSALADSDSRIGFEARTEFEAHPRIAEPMGLFLSEAITNALKHARGAYIRVVLRIGGQDLLLEVADNGPGLPPAFDKKDSSGFRLMRSLASQLNGRIELDKCFGTGLCVRLIMPK